MSASESYGCVVQAEGYNGTACYFSMISLLTWIWERAAADEYKLSKICYFGNLICHAVSLCLCLCLCLGLCLFVFVSRVIHRVLKTLMLQGYLYEVTLEYTS